MNPNFADKVQSKPYDPLKINSEDINELKHSVISKVGADDLEDAVALLEAADDAILSTIADNQEAIEQELANESSVRANAIADLQEDFDSQIDSEANVRASADADLQTAINTKASLTLVNAEIANRINDVQSEAVARQIVDEVLQSEIDSKANQASLTTEINLRVNGDAYLQSSIDSKATQSALNTEISNRQSADSTLNSKVDTETSSRIAADSTLNSKIDTETSNRIAADAAINSVIADLANSDALVNEANARIAGDATLQTAINLKSNKTYVDSQLALKADATDVEIELLTKADLADLETKADIVGGIVPLVQLPAVYFSGGTGTGTQSNPYFFCSNGLSPEQLVTYFQGLPNWAPDRMLLGSMTWVDVPTGGGGDLEKLDTPTFAAFTNNNGDAVTINWNTVTNGTTYTLQRDTNNTFASAVTVYSGSLSSYTNVGLTPVTQYYYRLRATASGFAGSNYATANVTTATQGNVTPLAPTAFSANDTSDTFTFTNTSGYATNLHEYRIKLSGTWGAWTAITTKPISVGDIAIPVGDIEIRVKAHTGVNAGATLASNVAFTVAMGDGSAPLDTTFATLQDAVNSAVNTYRLDVAPKEYGYLGINNNLVLHSGAVGWISMDVISSAPSGRLTLTNSPTDAIGPSDGGATGAHVRLDRNYLSGGLSITGRMNGTNYGGVSVPSSTTKIRLRTDGTTLYTEWFDGTWHTAQSASQVGTLYIRGYMQKVRNADGNDDEVNFEREALRNVRIFGFNSL